MRFSPSPGYGTKIVSKCSYPLSHHPSKLLILYVKSSLVWQDKTSLQIRTWMSREVEKDVGGIGEGKEHDQDLLHKILRKINKDKFLQNHFAKKKCYHCLE